MYLPNAIGRQRVVAAASEYGLYFAGGQLSSGSFFQDTWYHVIPRVKVAMSSTSFHQP